MSQQQLRIGHEERDAAVAALADHYAAGRITQEEYDERAEQVWEARTVADLRPVFADLPGGLSRAGADRGDRGARRERREGGPTWPWRAFPVFLVPFVVGLVLLSALTHLPWILLGVLAWFCWTRMVWGGPPWSRRVR